MQPPKTEMAILAEGFGDLPYGSVVIGLSYFAGERFHWVIYRTEAL